MKQVKEDVLGLLLRVPAPPGETLPRGVSETILRAAEHRHGITFPSKLREWALTMNGPCVGPGGLVGIATPRRSQDLDAIYNNFPAWRHNGWIPVAGDGCGSYYVVATKGEFGADEPVLFVDVHVTTESPAFVAASDIWLFLRFLLSKELGESAWPYDSAEVISADPNIAAIKNVTLPWHA